MIHRTDMNRSRRDSGFTIIEVLVAIALFAIVILVILAPLTGLFGLSQRSAQQTSATNLAQQAMETIRGQWLNLSRYQYGLNCVTGPLTSSAVNPTVVVQDEDAQGNRQTNVAAFSVQTAATCPSYPPSGVTTFSQGPPLRRVTVTATVNGTTSTLVAEVARP